MNRTGIEYLDYTWNPTHGCSPVSFGCNNCWARTMSKRLAGMGVSGYSPDAPFKAVCSPEKLDEPFRVNKPAVIGVSFMGDLFHDDVPFEFIEQIHDVIRECRIHTFILLTKRPQRANDYWQWRQNEYLQPSQNSVPPDNVILGVSIEDQATADERIPWLLKTPAATRMVSFEPGLGAVSMWEWFPDGSCEKPQFCKDLAWHKNPAYENGIDWIVMGGESGPGARPMHPYWARSMRDQCERARVPFFFKQYGEWVRCGMVEDETKYKCQIIDGTIMCRVGKKTAGHILDGIVHDYLPEILR